MSRRLSGAAAAMIAFVMPAVASAAEGGRALETPEDASRVVMVTVLGVVTLFLLASLGRLYQIRRSLHWPFQDPDSGDHGGAH